MKQIFKCSILLITFLMVSVVNAQWVVTPSTPITSFSQPHWKIDADLNNDYMVMTYGNQNPSTSPGGTGTWLKVYDSNSNPITSDIYVFNKGFSVSRVQISNANIIYVLGTHSYSSVSKLVLKRYTTSGAFLGSTIVNHNIGGAMFDLALADNNDVLVSLFEGDNLRIRAYNSNLIYKGLISVANGITHYHLPSSNLRAQNIDFKDGKILIGYSRGVHSSLTSYIKKYTYNTTNPAVSLLTNIYTFTGGFNRRDLLNNNSHQIALRSNGDVFYVNGLYGVKRISGASTYNVYPNPKVKVNVDIADNLLISWTDNTRARARLYNVGNSFVHYYQEDGNMNGSWASTFHDCKFVLAGDKSFQGTNYHTNRKPYYQVFNCSDCEVGASSTADFDFRFPNQVISMPSLYGPQEVTELCLVDDLLVDGTPSCNEDGYFVEIAEFDLMGWNNIVVLHSAWVCTGCTAPNNIDIASFLPAGYQLRPNKVYRFRLAVGPTWHSVDKFFTIACCEREIIEIGEEDHQIEIPRGKQVQDSEELEIAMVPNPAKDFVTVDLSKEDMNGEVTISITNISGRVLFTKTTEERKVEIDISKWEQGIYLCNVSINGQKTVKKIIKR